MSCSGSRDARGVSRTGVLLCPNKRARGPGCSCLSPGQKQQAHRQRKRPQVSTPNTRHSTIPSRLRDTRPVSYRSEISEPSSERIFPQTAADSQRLLSISTSIQPKIRESTSRNFEHPAAPWTSSLDLDRHRPSRTYLPEPSCLYLRARLGYPAPLQRPRSRLDPSRP